MNILTKSRRYVSQFLRQLARKFLRQELKQLHYELSSSRNEVADLRSLLPILHAQLASSKSVEIGYLEKIMVYQQAVEEAKVVLQNIRVRAEEIQFGCHVLQAALTEAYDAPVNIVGKSE